MAIFITDIGLQVQPRKTKKGKSNPLIKIQKELSKQIKYKVKEATPSMTNDGIFTKDAVAPQTNKKTEFSDSHLNSEPVENPNKNTPVPIYHCNDDPTLTAKMISTQSLESELEDRKSPCEMEPALGKGKEKMRGKEIMGGKEKRKGSDKFSCPLPGCAFVPRLASKQQMYAHYGIEHYR